MELLIVIGIIGLLAATIVPALLGARVKANIGKAQAELRTFHIGITEMENDIVKWPNGCHPTVVDISVGNEIMIDDACSGLFEEPQIAPACSCGWTASDVSLWDGPYSSISPDPWGNTYWYDPDYYPRRDCAEKDPDRPDTIAVSALVSLGVNGTGGPDAENYDCDDVYRVVE